MIFAFVLRNSVHKSFVFGAKNSSAGYNFFVAMLGGPTTVEPKRNFSRYLTMMWIILFFVLRNSYQSYLYQALKMDLVSEPPKTYKDLMDKGYFIWVNTFIYNYTKHLTARFANHFIVDDSYYIDLFQKMMDMNAKVGILSPEIYNGYFRRKARENSRNLYLLNDVLHVYQLTIFMKKNFFMRDVIDRAILEYINNGLLERWESINVDRTNYKRTPPATKTMTLYEALGALLILLNGLTLSIFVFLFELVAFHFKIFVTRKKVKHKLSLSSF